MILEVLVSSTPTDKTFYYKADVSKMVKPCIGQIVKLKFRKKNQMGLILNLHNQLDLDFKLLEIDEILEDLVFQKKF